MLPTDPANSTPNDPDISGAPVSPRNAGLQKSTAESPKAEHLPAEMRQVANEIATALQSHGHRAYLVGGCVRDLVLGRAVHDLDFTTAATPEQLSEIFRVTHEVGRAFGTLVTQTTLGPVEITTFRREGAYLDGRRPERVEFSTSLEEDSRRRDFTCNALYLDPLDNTLEDPQAGLPDLKNNLLRCVGDPVHRFAEDGLRLLRLARFAVTLELNIDPATAAAAHGRLDWLHGVSPERALGEMQRVFSAARGTQWLARMSQLGILSGMFPGLLPKQAPQVSEESLQSAAEHLQRAQISNDLPAALATLLPDGPALDSLPLAKSQRHAISDTRKASAQLQTLFQNLQANGQVKPSDLARVRRNPQWQSAWQLSSTAQPNPPQDQQHWQSLLQQLQALSAEAAQPKPLLTSKDLIAAGLQPGPQFGPLLAKALDAQINAEFSDHAGALAWLASTL